MRKHNGDGGDAYPPIVDYFNKLKAFLDCDEEIVTELDYKNSTISITISNAPKAAAWRQILPSEKMFGDQKATIDIYCDKEGVDANVLVTAMSGNRAFSRYENIIIPHTKAERHFCYMNPMIIQFYNDNFASPESLETRLAEDLAKELFKIPELNYCTEQIINKEN